MQILGKAHEISKNPKKGCFFVKIWYNKRVGLCEIYRNSIIPKSYIVGYCQKHIENTNGNIALQRKDVIPIVTP